MAINKDFNTYGYRGYLDFDEEAIHLDIGADGRPTAFGESIG